MEVKVLRMNTGEEIIYTQINETDEYVEVENALVALPNAQGQIGFSPWSYLSADDATIKISRDYIVYIIEAKDMVVENYKKIFSKIETPSKKLIL
tara:strand:+ start:14629 stop:14913 length:285 start_codon:yes stop_codon:yes gene_type:complete